MNIGAIARRSAGTGAAIAALLAITPAANADVTPIYVTGPCGDPALSQPFLAWGDSACYALAPGESPNSFSATGWTLSGGARIISTPLANGANGNVLNLPSGSTAISPPVWINSSDPTARTMVRDVAGAEGVYFYISYPNSAAWKNTGQVHGTGTAWTLSNHINLQTSGLTDWQLAQFKFVAGGNTSDFQIYNFYYQATSNTSNTNVTGDPRMKS
jgi:hypothetical protein